MRNVLLSLLLLSTSVISLAGEADVLSAEVEHLNGDFYRFKVSVHHTDENWDHFAKAWEVLSPDGTKLGARILQHPHINEQPFTRSMTITIPKQINKVNIRAYDLIHEFGGKELTIDINKDKQDDIN
jgi:hypothetical protein